MTKKVSNINIKMVNSYHNSLKFYIKNQFSLIKDKKLYTSNCHNIFWDVIIPYDWNCMIYIWIHFTSVTKSVQAFPLNLWENNDIYF